jgi:transposase
VASGNDERAGKQRSGKTRRGNRTLRMGLIQMAHAVVWTKGTSLSALYERLAARRGKRRAIMAVSHAIVVSAFHMPLAMNHIVSWGPTTLMFIGVTTSSTA